MAFEHGSKAVLKMQNAAGTMVDITQYLRSATMPRELDASETTTLGKTARTYIPGLKGRSFSADGVFDPVIDGILYDTDGMVRNFEYYPQGTAIGKVRYSGAFFTTTYEQSSNTDDPGTFSVEWQITDDVTRALVT